MKLVTWNVNGLRSVFDKGFPAWLRQTNPDIVLLQETKVTASAMDWSALSDWEYHWNPAAKPGYSGTVLLSKIKPLRVSNGIGMPEHDNEGRVLTAEYPGCYVVSVYTPNSRAELVRLPYRMAWDKAFLEYLRMLDASKPVLCAGDLNVAHKEIDLARPSSNRRSPGFTDEERSGMDLLLANGFLDVFREFDPSPHRYSWWSYRAGARGKNVGWRLDYWLASKSLRQRLKNCEIHAHITGSDHCPVLLEADDDLFA